MIASLDGCNPSLPLQVTRVPKCPSKLEDIDNLFYLNPSTTLCGPRILARCVPNRWHDSLFVYLVKI